MAFLEPTPILGRRTVKLLAACKETTKPFRRTPRDPSCRLRRRQGQLLVTSMGTSTDESFENLASDIRDYLKTRPDSESNPLAYITLRNAGRLDLVSRIMEAGGYIEVSRALGVRLDESQFIPPPPTFSSSSKPSPDIADDNNASLVVGRDLEERLNTIEEVMKKGGNQVDPARARTEPAVLISDDNVPTGKELRIQNQTVSPVIVDEPIPVGERLTLTTGMRIGLLCLGTVSAIGLGRSSLGTVSDDVIVLCRSMTYGLLLAHVVLGAYAGGTAARKGRNPFLWFIKALLGGPLGIQHLRELDVLPE